MLYKTADQEKFEGIVGYHKVPWGIAKIYNVIDVRHDLFT